MFLQNYINHRWNMFFCTLSASDSRYGVYGRNLVDISGATIAMASHADIRLSDIGMAMGAGIGTSATLQGRGIYLGTGPTPATLADYTMEAPITSGLEKIHTAVSIAKEAEGRYSICGQYTVKNVSGEPLNIYEIGCITLVPTSTTANNSAPKAVLMERTVLAEPITIGRDEIKLITYKLTFNHALNIDEPGEAVE